MPPHRGLTMLVLVLALGACGSGDDPAMQPPGGGDLTTTSLPVPTTADGQGRADEDARVIEVEVVDGRPVDGPRREQVERGEQVVILVTTDTADEVHVHGYDVEATLAPDEVTTITLTADLPGVWAVELHGNGVLLFELEVG